jgi:hypothetical protein
MFRKVKVSERLPEMGKFVTTIDLANEHRVYRLTENGWNMRDADGDNSPNNNLPIIFWLEEINDYGSQELIGNVDSMFKDLEHKQFDWRSFLNGWIEGRYAMLEENGYFNK